MQSYTYSFLFVASQPVFLADFKQIKKIQCLSQSDGKALITLNIEGARQVSNSPPVGLIQPSALIVRLLSFCVL